MSTSLAVLSLSYAQNQSTSNKASQSETLELLCRHATITDHLSLSFICFLYCSFIVVLFPTRPDNCKHKLDCSGKNSHEHRQFVIDYSSIDCQ